MRMAGESAGGSEIVIRLRNFAALITTLGGKGMRNFHLFPLWGVMAILVWGMAMTAPGASGASKDGIKFTINEGHSFTEIVDMIAKGAGLKLVMLATVDARLGKINYSTETLPEQIIKDLALSQGLDFWQNGDTYYIGQRNSVPVTPVIDPLPYPPSHTQPVTSNAGAARSYLDYQTESPQYAPPAKQPFYIRTIELQHSSPTDMAWMFGAKSGKLPSAQIRPALNQRIHTVLDPRTARVNLDANGNSISPAFSSPWNNSMGTGTVSRRESSTDGNQFGGAITNPAAGSGFQPGTGAAAPPGAAAPAARTGLGGDLASFLPDGIEDIVALVGLNALLVRATNEDALDKLELLIKMLDKPVKQVIIEAMIVKMDVVDAQSMGVSWEWAGMPVSITNSNPSGGGNFSVRYVKGNVKAALDSMITSSKAKVVSAPRVIVQNGGQANVTMNDSVPFIMIEETEDVFGRVVQTPTISMQDFPNSLTVNEVTIHPDGYVTLDVDPQLVAPGASVAIPGGSGSGSVSGSSDFTVQTILRVKNGETIMMGGFVNRIELEGGSRTPLLSDLPVIGPLLFRNSSKNWNNSETLLFITPTIMEEDSTSFEGMQSLPPIW